MLPRAKGLRAQCHPTGGQKCGQFSTTRFELSIWHVIQTYDHEDRMENAGGVRGGGAQWANLGLQAVELNFTIGPRISSMARL